MRIALAIERFKPSAGGAERSTAQIAEELARRGHQVTIVCGRLSHDEPPPGVEALAVCPIKPRSTAGLLIFRRAMVRALDSGSYDATLSITTTVPAAVVQPRGGLIRQAIDRRAASRSNSTSRAARRAVAMLTPKYLTQLALERQTLRDPRVRRVVAVSAYVADSLRRHYGIEDERVEIIPNAAVVPSVPPEERARQREAVRTGLRIGDATTAFLFAAMDPRRKGFEPLLHALARATTAGTDAVLLLAGEFWYGHQSRVADMGLRDRVRFIRHTRSMPALYAAADATVLPTFDDPSSKVVIESLMLGTPAISSAYNGASDFIEPPGGPNRGIVVPEPWDIAGLAAALTRMADPAARGRFAAACAGLADELSMARHVEHLERVLEEAAASPPLAA